MQQITCAASHATGAGHVTHHAADHVTGHATNHASGHASGHFVQNGGYEDAAWYDLGAGAGGCGDFASDGQQQHVHVSYAATPDGGAYGDAYGAAYGGAYGGAHHGATPGDESTDGELGGSPGSGVLDVELSRIDSEIASLQRSLEAATQQAEAVAFESYVPPVSCV
eukprot:7172075-Prymnesium_polylepis.1